MSAQELKEILESWIFTFYKTAPLYEIEFVNGMLIKEGESIAKYELKKSGPNFYMTFSNTNNIALDDFENIWVYVDHDERFPIKINHSTGDRKFILVTERLRQ